MNDIAGAILNAVGEQRDEFLSFLEKLVVHESPSLVPKSQEPIFELIGEALDEIGYEIRRIPGNESGGQLLAAPSGSDFGGVDLAASAPDDGSFSPVQLLMGHCDTVWPIGTLKKMPVQIDDSIMRGPGVFDMKAGLAQTVFALQTLHRLDIKPALVPLVFINSDEEIGSNDSAANIVRLAQFASRVFVMEPALGLSGKLKTGRRGVSQFVVNVTGKAAHAGLDPEAGASAILELSHQIQRLFDLNDPLKGVSVNVGIIGGGLRPNVIAPESQAIVDVRVPDSIEAERITAAIHGLEPAIKGVSLKVEKSLERAPMERTPRNQALWKLALEAARDLGLEIEQGISGGASDGNLTSPFVATLDGLGAVGDGAHANHEYINVAKSVERCALLAMLIMAESPTSGEKDAPDSSERKDSDSAP
tara:strand:- start:230 stop:1486 length:1257 start_codon:yes stop_codon:yes gene_type:complete